MATPTAFSLFTPTSLFPLRPKPHPSLLHLHRHLPLKTLSVSAYKVTFEHEGSTRTLEVGPDETILEKALDEGLSVPHDCKLGVCMTCPARLLSGAVDQSEGMLSDDVVESVVRGRQQPIEDPIDLNNKNNENKSTKNKPIAKQDITRFGQRAYVLGAINGEICIREDDYNGFLASLNTREP